ncbi:MAG: GNAT family N-acetyltransferase [Rhodanobacteraceae bacterium]
MVLGAPLREAPHWTETLEDGTHIIIRPIHKEDAALDRGFIQSLSAESKRLRFLGQINEPSVELIRQLTDIDYQRDIGFVALIHRNGSKQEIGVARYGTSEDGSVCEFAVTVADEWHHRGVGMVLMKHQIDVAKGRGIRSMISLDAAGNVGMRDLAMSLGFRRRSDPQDPTQVIHSLDLQ